MGSIAGWLRWAAVGAALALGGAAMAQAQPHNVILFVADGLRAESVTPQAAPTMSALAKRGVSFPNSHSIYPTLTTVNATALATGHLPGDTGEYGNTLWLGFISRCPRGTGVFGPIGNVENDCVLGDLNDNIGGGDNYLGETSVLAAAQARGYSTAAVGKLGPAVLQDVRQSVRLGDSTIILDDLTNKAAGGGVPVSDEVLAAIRAAGLPEEALGRADNGESGDVNTRGTRFANVYQQDWFAEVAARVLIPRFKRAGKPFALVFWSRDPDGTQHQQGDSFQSLLPGINGPTSAAAVRNADHDLARLLEALRAEGLEATTDVIVTSDHGFSTVAKTSRTSLAVKGSFDNTRYGELPFGFVALDLAQALNLPLYEPSAMAKPDGAEALDPTKTAPRGGDALLGPDPTAPEVLIAANSGTDLIYLPTARARELAPRIAAALQAQDYAGGLFVDDALGPIPGTLPFSLIGFNGTGRTPKPAMVLALRTFVVPGCAAGSPLLCTAVVADAGYQTGQGTHGSPSRAETFNFTAAAGPSFKAGYADPAPVSNADIGVTMARLLRLDLKPKGRLTGRVMTEALKGGVETPVSADTVRSTPGPGGLVMTLNRQSAGGRNYLDAAGYPGRVVGLTP